MRSQHLAAATRLGADPVEPARALCGVQAQDYFAGTMQLRVRSRGLTASSVDDAVARTRSLVRTWLMRGTLHLCAAEDIRWLLGILGPINLQRQASRRRQLGLDDALCERSVRIIRRLLANGAMTRHELRAQLIAKGLPIDPSGQALIHVLGYAALRGVLVLGPKRSRDSPFVLLDDWVPDAPRPTGDAALAQLARRYLAAYGPANAHDLAAWAGLPMTVARRALTSIGGELVEFPGDIRGLWTLGSGSPSARTPSRRRAELRLLPHFDTYVLGYQRRDHMMHPAHHQHLAEGGGGWIRPMVSVDGWLSGGWRLTRRATGAAVAVTMFEDEDADPRGLEAEVKAIGAFLGVPARWQMTGSLAAGGQR